MTQDASIALLEAILAKAEKGEIELSNKPFVPPTKELLYDQK